MKKDRKKNIEDELKELSPFLFEMKKEKPGLSTPENYFHFLENSILEQVSLEAQPDVLTNQKAKKKTWFSFFSPRVAVSFASVLVLVVAGLFFINKGAEQIVENSDAFVDLTEEEILDYLADNIDDFDDYSLGEITEDISEFEMIEVNEEDADYFLENLEEQDLENLF